MEKVSTFCGQCVTVTQGGTKNPPEEDDNAKRTARPEAPSGRDRQCSTYCADRDRRSTGNNTSGLQGDSQKGHCGEVGLMEITSPRWSRVKASANNLTADFSAPPIPVLEIAESNGVDVVFAGFGELTDKVSGFCDFKAAKLFVNEADQLNRQLFTIAHEFGHWMLHRPIFEADPDRYPVLPRFSDPNRDDVLEKEANCFAANLLVPEKLLKPIKNAPVAALASAFGVSVTMMEFRLKNVR